MAALATIKADLKDEINSLQNALIPFDRLFDEDELEANREKLSILHDEVDRLENSLITSICSQQGAYSDARYQAALEKLRTFTARYEAVKNKIAAMLFEREVKHDVWKQSYTKVSEEIMTRNTSLQRIEKLETELEKVRAMKIKVRHNIVLLISLHSQVNFLLALRGTRKQNLPFAAFKSAHTEKLIDDDTYKALTS
jgi:DNA repair exonuclease SbcCD ATPase subunit